MVSGLDKNGHGEFVLQLNNGLVFKLKKLFIFLKYRFLFCLSEKRKLRVKNAFLLCFCQHTVQNIATTKLFYAFIDLRMLQYWSLWNLNFFLLNFAMFRFYIQMTDPASTIKLVL